MVQKTRVLLQESDKIKKFLFVSPAEDGTISFGSSLPRPKELKIGTVTIPAEKQKGTNYIDFKDTKDLNPEISHFSYHPSPCSDAATLHLKTNQGDYLMKYKVGRLSEMKDVKRIFTVIPSNPSKYPLFTKIKAKNDIIIPIDIFQHKPFHVGVFLAKKDYEPTRVVVSNDLNTMLGVCENKDFLLIIKLYQKITYNQWPRLTAFVPVVDGIDIE